MVGAAAIDPHAEIPDSLESDTYTNKQNSPEKEQFKFWIHF